MVNAVFPFWIFTCHRRIILYFNDLNLPIFVTAKKTQLRYDMDSGGELSAKGSETGKSGGEEKKKKKKGRLVNIWEKIGQIPKEETVMYYK